MKSILAALLPPNIYNPIQPRLNAELTADANALDKVRRSALSVANSVTPFYSVDLLEDWERVIGINNNHKTHQERLSLVLVKLAETGGLSIPYFIGMAKSMSYEITIDEPQPFRAGVNRAGDVIYTPDIIYVWFVNIFNSKTVTLRFRSGASLAGEKLTSFGDSVIEFIINELKPAHTLAVFTYRS